GHLIRYRVEATNAVTTSRVPRADDTINYRGVVVPSGVSSPIPVLEWFIADADYNAMVNAPTTDITRTAALAYGGTVYDNVQVNIKGHASQSDPKVSWKFHLPKNHDLDMPGVITEPVDEFDMQADWSDKSHGRSILSWEAYQRAGIVNHQMFPVRTQRNGAFQGLYNFNEVFDGTWRKREGYDDKEVYSADTSAFTASRPVNVRFTKENPDDGNYASLQAFLNGVNLTGNAQRDFLLANADIPKMLNYAAVTAIVEHVDSATKNFDLVFNPNTGRWKIIPWDLDHTLGNGCCNVNSNFVTPAEPGDNTSALMRALLAVPQWKDMYFRRLRTLVNDILAPNRMESLYDTVVGPAQPVGTLDIGAWPYPSGTTFATFRTRLFNAIQDRRNAFASDSRVPGNQPAAPDMVIDEIQHSPTAGDDA
ncbi:CotH kinase family protein, partial [Nocardioides sp. URHA0032]|uniref:CotH kinase family protein n=1 Tax=Nocardioides sp. URHA0032 TaxID=1380388 RepID=UPI00056D6D62